MWVAALCAALALLTLGFAPAASAGVVVAQPQGGFVIGGETPFHLGFVARLDNRGDPVPGFGTDGVVVDHNLSSVIGVALQPDGRILALTQWQIARYEPDGRLDESFGEGGYAQLPFALNSPQELLVLPDGRIVVGGNALRKLFPSAALVAVFSSEGHLEWLSGTGLETYMGSLIASDDGSLLVAGGDWTSKKDFLARLVPGAAPSYPFSYDTVTHYPPPRPGYDRSFGAGAGLVWFAFPAPKPLPYFGIRALASAPGEIYVAGGVGRRSALVRFGEDGVLDESFGRQGFRTFWFGPRAYAVPADVAVTSGGRLTFLGEIDLPDDGLGYCGRCETPFAARFLPDGRFDPDFGRRGVAKLPGVFGPRRGAKSRNLLLLSSGKVLVAGIVEPDEVVLGRFGPGGDPDASFGKKGVVRFRPCKGTVRRQRRANCIPTARAELQLRATPRGAALRLEVSSVSEWANIGYVQMRLPRSVEVRQGQVKRAKFSFRDPEGKRRRTSATLRGRSLVFPHFLGVGTERMAIDIPPGVLRWGSRGVPASLRLGVEFRVSSREGGFQTLVVRRRG
jgi:uncharacterized delta-60 repeat protein